MLMRMGAIILWTAYATMNVDAPEASFEFNSSPPMPHWVIYAGTSSPLKSQQQTDVIRIEGIRYRRPMTAHNDCTQWQPVS